MARDREEHEPTDRLADAVAARVIAELSSQLDQFRRGLVELAGSVAELHARQQEMGEQIGVQTSNAMVKVVEHVEALLAATGWAILDKMRNETGDAYSGAASNRSDEATATHPQ